MKHAICTLVCLLALAGCDDDAPSDDAAVGVDGGDTDAGGDGVDSGTDPVDAGGDPVDGGGVDAGGGSDAGGSAACDYESSGGVIVIEAEELPITEQWRVASSASGHSGSGYIEWTGSSFNNDPTHGVIEVALRFAAAGRYRLQWRTRVGMGTDATEHNDTWVRFADAADFYGSQGALTAEDRVYPRPICDDATFMDGIRAMSGVAEATCPNGSTRDGFFKVYSSGALDWRWSAFTSDSDGHQIIIQIDTPGVYTMELAARADFSQLDRIVIHEASMADAAVQDLVLPVTSCP